MATTPSIPLETLVAGYPKLSGRMELFPENAIFRRFGALNALDLLYRQAELIHLEWKLREQEKSDNTSNADGTKTYALHWYYLAHPEEPGSGEQWELFQEIREKLQAYNQCLVHQSTILGLSQPGKYEINHLQHYLEGRDMDSCMFGPDSYVWGSVDDPKEHCPDLVSLKNRPREDVFSRWMSERVVTKAFQWGLQRWMKPSKVYGTTVIQERTILRITYCITTGIASLLPILSITILYIVRSMPARLVIIGSFNFIVSVCLSAFASARRTDVFAVAAAFSAVQVVFVTVNNSNNTNV